MKKEKIKKKGNAKDERDLRKRLAERKRIKVTKPAKAQVTK